MFSIPYGDEAKDSFHCSSGWTSLELCQYTWPQYVHKGENNLQPKLLQKPTMISLIWRVHSYVTLAVQSDDNATEAMKATQKHSALFGDYNEHYFV